MKEKMIKITSAIFSGVTALLMALFVLILAAYIIAMVAGGAAAVQIHGFISVNVLPRIYLISVVASFTALLNMYLKGEKAFTLDSDKNQKK